MTKRLSDLGNSPQAAGTDKLVTARSPNVPDVLTTIQKIGDRFYGGNTSLTNLQDQGAKGDGVTDDAAAINQAILNATNQGGGTVLLIVQPLQ